MNRKPEAWASCRFAARTGFYLPDRGEWERAVARLEGLGCRSVRSFNPYWDRQGRTFEDPDGWRVVLQNAGWGR